MPDEPRQDVTRATAAMPPESVHVLVVEDDPRMQKVLQRAFAAEGIEVISCGDGIEALERFRKARPSGVVLDLNLPRLSGREVCREMKAQAPEVPVLILSAQSEVVDKVLLFELGADDYVTKPFSPRELLARLQAALRRSRRARAVHATASVILPWGSSRLSQRMPAVRCCCSQSEDAAAATRRSRVRVGGTLPSRMSSVSRGERNASGKSRLT